MRPMGMGLQEPSDALPELPVVHSHSLCCFLNLNSERRKKKRERKRELPIARLASPCPCGMRVEDHLAPSTRRP
jgi:hypothetical protein